jgi:hypothetical protein
MAPVYKASVLSPVNLQCFLEWAAGASTTELVEVLEVVCLVNHRPHNYNVVPTRLGPNGCFAIREVLCQDVGCPRCTSGWGGWNFKFQDKRWTPSFAVSPPATDANNSRFLCYELPFPLGAIGLVRNQGVLDHAEALEAYKEAQDRWIRSDAYQRGKTTEVDTENRPVLGGWRPAAASTDAQLSCIFDGFKDAVEEHGSGAATGQCAGVGRTHATMAGQEAEDGGVLEAPVQEL